jgi:hypothetical protein
MATMLTRRAITAIVLLLSGFLAAPAFAKGTFKGTYGSEKFRSRKGAAGCSYFRSPVAPIEGTFSMIGAKGGRKRQTGAAAAGQGPDPTAPGAVFPIVLTSPVASFFDGVGATVNLWGGIEGDVVVTLTGYKKGKISGTVTGTLQAQPDNPKGPIQVNATFSGKCSLN